MTNQTLDFTDTDKAFIVQQLGAQLDSSILYSLLHGTHVQA